jgi:hypothetical protein
MGWSFEKQGLTLKPDHNGNVSLVQIGDPFCNDCIVSIIKVSFVVYQEQPLWQSTLRLPVSTKASSKSNRLEVKNKAMMLNC